ncbi:MAG: HD domain-containing protein [Tissierellia bacterium]|nr:HD domain-containing protein [Tissierellia bacterium]
MNSDNNKLLIENIGEKRFNHTIRVVETAEKLAKFYETNIESAKIAAYFHDCGKFLDKSLIWSKAEKYGLDIEDEMRQSPQIIHGFLAAKIIENDYGIEDIDILNSIRYHTTGRTNMSTLEKVIYISDYIEPGRSFEGVEIVRDMIYKNLDMALYTALNQTINNLIVNDIYIAKNSFLARNYYLLEYKR